MNVAAAGPPTLSFQELITAAEVDPPPPELQRKLDILFDTPFVVNSAGQTPSSSYEAAPAALHIAEWNIFRTSDDEGVKLALTDASAFLERASKNHHLNRRRRDALKEQLNVLQRADVVILNEIDDGVDAEHYHNVPAELAQALHMNYTFAVEFLELNRIYLGTHSMDFADAGHAGRKANFGLDPSRYLGLEGTALLSRYPIRSSRIIHLPVAYDWYHDEIRALSDLERARRWTAERLFRERVLRQVRRGGRLALLVELNVPGAPGGVMTVVCPHLEDYCGPKGRQRQMDYLLSQIRTLQGPVVMGGDLNTTGHDGRPLTLSGILHHSLLSLDFWVREAGYFFFPVPGAGEMIRVGNLVKNWDDPTAVSLPVVMDNGERRLFTSLHSFQFADGGELDFSGDRRHSYQSRGSTLSDSAQRSWKGFTPSFRFDRNFHRMIGTYKLDWIFVKTNKDRPDSSLTPAFGRTFTLVNRAALPHISPHSPTGLEIRFDAPHQYLANGGE